MGKNRKFKTQYLVTVEGTTTNGFQAELFDNILRGVVQAVGVNSQQTKATVKVIESEGDYDAEKREPRNETE